MQFAEGFLLGGLIAVLAWRAHTLSTSGAWAAALTGGLIFGLGGWPWAVLLMTFFVSSSLLSRLFRKRKIALDEKFSKGSRRDWGQVLANGGLFAAGALAWGLFATIWLPYVDSRRSYRPVMESLARLGEFWYVDGRTWRP